MALLEEWEWGTTTVEDMVLPMAWVVTVSVFWFVFIPVCDADHVILHITFNTFYIDYLLLNNS